MVYPTVLKTGALKEIFGRIKSTGTPAKFSAQHLKSLGFTSSNDVAILSALKFVGFLDGSGKPTEKYTNYKGKDGAKILADGVRMGYSELFELYPDAEQKDEESLTHFFATKTDVGESSRKTMIATFKTLCSISDFKSPPLEIAKHQEVGRGEGKQGIQETAPTKAGLSPSININIELQIPATNDPEVYKNFFEAMKKYLIND